MMGHILKMNDPGQDRLLIVVGDNHKWVLEQFLSHSPEFRVVSSFDYLVKGVE